MVLKLLKRLISLILYLFQVVTLTDCIVQMQRQFSSLKAESLKDKIKDLPEAQQEYIMACVEAVRKKPKGIRYTRKFIYECILLKIRSMSTYCYLRRRKILPLPSRSTIFKYMRKIKPAFGFQNNIFETMKLKSETMRPQERRGML